MADYDRTKNFTTIAWPDWARSLVKDLWRDGKSATEIALALARHRPAHPATRNSVIGIVARAGDECRRTGATAEISRAKTARASAARLRIVREEYLANLDGVGNSNRNASGRKPRSEEQKAKRRVKPQRPSENVKPQIAEVVTTIERDPIRPQWAKAVKHVHYVDRELPADAIRLPLLTLGRFQCHFPGPEINGERLYCGKPTLGHHSYCPACQNVMYVATKHPKDEAARMAAQ